MPRKRNRMAPVETPYNTRMQGRIVRLPHADEKEQMVRIQMASDPNCALLVPLVRIPRTARKNDTAVIVFLTTMYGQFGVVAAEDEARRAPAIPARDVT